jgi:protein TonB
LSRRLGEQGTVHLHIAIDASGTISAVTVEQSSGSTRLDEAAVTWVRSHWRYHPAKIDDRPVASTARAAVVFDLTQRR